MIKINEKFLLVIGLADGFGLAKADFKKYHKFDLEDDPYDIIFRDIIEILYKDDQSFFDGKIQNIDIIKEVDESLLDLLLNLVRKYTYSLDLRIMKSNNNKRIYLCLDKVYNKNTYYVDNQNEEKKVFKYLKAEYWK